MLYRGYFWTRLRIQESVKHALHTVRLTTGDEHDGEG